MGAVIATFNKLFLASREKLPELSIAAIALLWFLIIPSCPNKWCLRVRKRGCQQGIKKEVGSRPAGTPGDPVVGSCCAPGANRM